MSRLQVFGIDFDGLTTELLDGVAREAKDYMYSIAPAGSTGRLRGSIGISKLGISARKVGASDPRKYPRIALLDIGPFEIRPKRAKVLRFISQTTGKPVFAKFVIHPGGHHVISRTEDWIENRLGGITDKIMVRRLKGGTG